VVIIPGNVIIGVKLNLLCVFLEITVQENVFLQAENE
jgi:hypothetical protein